tara:strand:- start:430 stop:702 length:273 start_codon:yes stop_codon:yes gene_type:complete
MKITTKYLQALIKEEIQKLLKESVAGLSREKEFKDASDTSVEKTTTALASDQPAEPTDSEREQFDVQSDEERTQWLFDRVQEIRKDLGHI